MAQNDVFVYTMNQGGTRGKWSRYRFPFIIEHHAHLGDKIYLRSGDSIYVVNENDLFDDGLPFESVIQWPWLDWGQPAVTKMLMGFDVAGEGEVTVEIGFNQNSLTDFTTPFTIPGDTYPGHIIPMAVSAPSFSLKLTYSSESNWEWNAANLYVQDFEVRK